MSSGDEALSVPLSIAPAPDAASQRRRTIIATSIGNMLEWYDFTIYALLAPYIAENFFPGESKDVRVIKAFLFFGLGFVVRPLGAIVLGSYGDRAGRKAALSLTILLMAAGTGLIAVSPSYARIGWGAPVLLLLGRVLQGFSAGGEIGGTTAYLLETGDPALRGQITSWLEASMGFANILGALAAFLVSALFTTEEIHGWAWRLPFVFGLTIAPVGLYLRRSLKESAEFVAARAVRTTRPAPLREVFQRHAGTLATGGTVAILWAVAVYVLMVFFPTYVQRPDTFGFTAQQAFGASALSNVPFVFACVLFGAASDRIGRRRSLSLSACAMLVCIVPLFSWLKADPTFGTLLCVQSCICILVASFVGVAPAALSEIFPAEVRSTGTSLVYNAAFTVFGGFSPMILTWAKRGSLDSLYLPAWYVMTAACLALLAIPLLRRRNA